MARKPKAKDDLRAELDAFTAKPQEPADVALLRKMLEEERRRTRKLESVHKIVVDAAREILEPLRIPTVVRPLKLKSPKKGGADAESQVLHLSDLQIGKTTATYSVERFEIEMEDLFTTTVELAEIMRSHHPVDELVIAANGDLVEGEQIFPGQAWVSQAPVIRQAARGAQILATKIAAIAPHYPKIRIKVTRGNHGRGGKEWCELSNWDLVLGEFLRLLLADLPNVEVDVCEGWYESTEVKGKILMQTHGDRIRSGGDTPFTAILKRGTNWIASIPGSFDVLVIGHFHNYAEFLWHQRSIFVNGSPESSNDYAESYMGMSSRPLQGVFFLHRRRGVTYRTPVYLGRGLEGVRGVM